MIIELVLDVVLGILSTLFGLLPSLPSLPAAVTDVWSQILGYLNQGMGFVGSWLYLPVALPCMGIVVAVELWDDFLQNASVVYGKNSFFKYSSLGGIFLTMLIDLSTGFVVCAIEGFLDTIDDYLDSSGYSIGSTGQLINQKGRLVDAFRENLTIVEFV